MPVPPERRRLDETLSSPPFTDQDSVYRLVRNQLANSSIHSDKENIQSTNSIDESAEYWFSHVWALLGLLRSASGEEAQNFRHLDEDDCLENGWKLKADTGQMRVMYREGPKGSPFHTLLAEGLIYSPLVSALCLAWEVPSYANWWPQFTIPSFRIAESRWVKRLHIGEDLSLIRVKVPSPFAMREVLMMAFELEHFEQDLILVILQSAPIPEEMDQKIHGFTAADVPDITSGAVRMDITGGFALQRVTDSVSYFRTIASLDMKMDFVPSWLINFVSRQLIGHGFKLYQKALSSISNGEGQSELFKKLMETEPMYKHVQLGLHARGKNLPGCISEKLGSSYHHNLKANGTTDLDEQDAGRLSNKPLLQKERLLSPTFNAVPSVLTLKDKQLSCSNNCTALKDNVENSRDSVSVEIDPEVQAALQILDDVIALVQATAARSVTLNPILQQFENVTKAIKELVNSLDTSCSLHVSGQIDTDGSKECVSSEASQHSEKGVQMLAGMDQPQETDTNIGNTGTLKVRKCKPKRSRYFLCFLAP